MAESNNNKVSSPEKLSTSAMTSLLLFMGLQCYYIKACTPTRIRRISINVLGAHDVWCSRILQPSGGMRRAEIVDPLRNRFKERLRGCCRAQTLSELGEWSRFM